MGEVHVVFDTPGSMCETQKELEQNRRDSTADKGKNHSCIQILSATAVPHKWRALLACRKWKQCLTQYLATEMLTLVQTLLFKYTNICCNRRGCAVSDMQW